jgi:hypothetical protein
MESTQIHHTRITYIVKCATSHVREESLLTSPAHGQPFLKAVEPLLGRDQKLQH